MTLGQAAKDVVVVTGIGGMGQAVSRQLGGGCTLVLADVSEARVGPFADSLRTDGYVVHTVRTDVSSRDDLASLSRTANDLGPLRCVVHTAGVSPVQATAEQIVAVDLIGTRDCWTRSSPRAPANGRGMHREHGRDDDAARSRDPEPPRDHADGRAAHRGARPSAMDPGIAYSVAKHAPSRYTSRPPRSAWGRRGGRVVSISPGIVATPQGNEELAGPSRDTMRQMIGMSALGGLGTPEDIAATVEFLVSPGASLITGTDVLVDGGIVAAIHQLPPGTIP